MSDPAPAWECVKRSVKQVSKLESKFLYLTIEFYKYIHKH